MRSFVPAVWTTTVPVVVRRGLVPAQFVVSAVLAEEKRDACPPIALTAVQHVFAKDDNGALPVVTVVVVFRVVHVVNYAPGGVARAIHGVNVDWKRSRFHQRAAVRLTAVGIDAVGPFSDEVSLEAMQASEGWGDTYRRLDRCSHSMAGLGWVPNQVRSGRCLRIRDSKSAQHCLIEHGSTEA